MALPTTIAAADRHARPAARQRDRSTRWRSRRRGLLRRAARAHAAAGVAAGRRAVVPARGRRRPTWRSRSASPKCCRTGSRSWRSSPSAPTRSTSRAPRRRKKRAEERLAQPQATSTTSARASRCMKSLIRLQVASRAQIAGRVGRQRMPPPQAERVIAVDADCPGPSARTPAFAAAATKTATARAPTSASSSSPTAWAATSPARSRRASPSRRSRPSSPKRAGADKNRTWPFPFEPHDQPRRQPPQGGVPPRQPPDRQRDGRLRRPARHGDDRVRGAGRARQRRASRTSATAASTRWRDGGTLRADHRRSLVGRGAGARRDDDRRRAARQHPWRNVVTRALSGGERSRDRHRRARRRSRASGCCSAPTACRASCRTTRSQRILGDRSATLDADLRAARSTRRTTAAVPTTSRRWSSSRRIDVP